METALLEIGLYGGFDRHATATRLGHTARPFALRRPGRVGVYMLRADESRPRLLWRSTRA